MKISEIDLLDIKQGLRFKSLDGISTGTVIAVDYLDDYSVYFIWDNEKEINNWFGNDCDCKVIKEEDTLIYDTKKLKREYVSRQQDFNKSLLKFVVEKSKDKKNKLFGLKLIGNEEEKLETILKELY